MAGLTSTEASAPQSSWLEELADVDIDWDSISLPSTPTPTPPTLSTAALSSSTEGVVPLSNGFSNVISDYDLLSSTKDESFYDTADFETLLPRPESSLSNQSAQQTPKRIIRGTFPPALKSNSPIPGLTSTICLRTLFCLGEALNVGCRAARDNQDMLLEFYCRVMSSHREDTIQHFVLADLTHDIPPFVNATFAS